MAPSTKSKSESVPPQVIVVLGCRVHEGGPQGALSRRLLRAAQVSQSLTSLPVVMSGGKSWNGVKEADAMGEWWTNAQMTSGRLHLEKNSNTTRQNAAQVAQLCNEFQYHHVVLVTCDFHMSRASGLFRRSGLVVSEAASEHQQSRLSSLRLTLREWGARALEPWQALFPPKMRK